MPYINCEDVSIQFHVIENKKRSLKNAVLNFYPFGEKTRNERVGFHAKKIEPLIKDGERVGLVRPNGSGKTTLLRTLSGIYHPSAGSLELSGSVATLLELSSGFDHDATGYENIYLRSLFYLANLSLRHQKLLTRLLSFQN